MRPERAWGDEHMDGRIDGRTDGRTDGWTDGWTNKRKSPVLQDFVPFGAAAQKEIKNKERKDRVRDHAIVHLQTATYLPDCLSLRDFVVHHLLV